MYFQESDWAKCGYRILTDQKVITHVRNEISYELQEDWAGCMKFDGVTNRPINRNAAGLVNRSINRTHHSRTRNRLKRHSRELNSAQWRHVVHHMGFAMHSVEWQTYEARFLIILTSIIHKNTVNEYQLSDIDLTWYLLETNITHEFRFCHSQSKQPAVLSRRK